MSTVRSWTPGLTEVTLCDTQCTHLLCSLPSFLLILLDKHQAHMHDSFTA